VSATNSEAFYLAVDCEYQPVEDELAEFTTSNLYIIEVSHLPMMNSSLSISICRFSLTSLLPSPRLGCSSLPCSARFLRVLFPHCASKFRDVIELG
jgi:hypothetical protein